MSRQLLEDLAELIELEESLADVVLGEQRDVRHRGDEAVSKAKRVHALESGQLAVQRGRGGAILQSHALVAFHRGGRDIDGLRAGEDAGELGQPDLFQMLGNEPVFIG